MFSSTVQSSIVSLFSSVGSKPLQLFGVSTDSDLPSDSIVHLLNDQTSLPLPPGSDAQLVTLPDTKDESSIQLSDISCTVLHIQSPTIKTTFIRCPADPGKSLGLIHPWFHIQFKELEREFSFEIGIQDTAGRIGVLRCSTFQDEARIEHLDPPLLHVPLDINPPNSTTSWRTLSIKVPTVLPHFASAPAPQLDYRPSLGKYASVRYVKVYANCRLRRIWFTRTPNSVVDGRNWEFGLYT